MRVFRGLALSVMAMASFSAASAALGQIVINEIVDDERDWDSTQIADTREFVELFNAGAAAVDISGWTLSVFDLPTAARTITDTLPPGSTILPGGYFVIGGPAVPNVNYMPFAGELWPNGRIIFELRDGPVETGTLIDAVGLETFSGNELANATQEQLDQIAAGQTVDNDPRGGIWGQTLSNNAIAPNVPNSVGRYLDGRDSNVNGRDFGYLPATPGASNNLPQVPAHIIPDVDAVPVGTQLGTDYYASFVLPRVIDPTVVGPVGSNPGGATGNINPKAIPASPQGGRAIMAWDETGGGNAVYSYSYVNKFELYAYIDTTDLNLGAATVQSEASTYGIGTTDPFYGTPNQAGLLTNTSTQNGNTGIGWHIQRAEAAGGGDTTTLLQLIDFNDGGDSVLSVGDWQIKQTIDLSTSAAAWHFLSIDYDPVTGDVVAKHNNDTYTFSTFTGLVGNFYVGYRENLPGTGHPVARPPTYDMFVAPAGLDGDFNGDGKVDAADYVWWRKNDGTQPKYDEWRGNFGATAPGAGSGSLAAVPEPASAMLAALGVLMLAVRRVGRRG